MTPLINGRSQHSPIRIDSNTEFDAAHGVTGGNGTVWAPWIIENYEINGTGYGYCIYIGNTTDYFVVSGCYLHHASGVGSDPYYPDSGFTLYLGENGTIIDNVLSSNDWNGLYLYGSSNNKISGNV
jgi:parallel beta-helix repeat protein